MKDLGIVFIHHRTDAATQQNIATFHKWNPNAKIVTVSGNEALLGGYGRRDLPEFDAIRRQFLGTDWECRAARPRRIAKDPCPRSRSDARFPPNYDTKAASENSESVRNQRRK